MLKTREDRTVEAFENIAVWLKHLGNGTASGNIGAVEGHAMLTRDALNGVSSSLDGISGSLESIATALHAIADAIEKNNEA